MPKPPWFAYRVKEDGFFDAECLEFASVAHVTHVENALAVLRRKALRPQLVYDESKLKRRRILVIWLSPNHWTDGYRYGNVSFEYDFGRLLKDRYFYWVEDLKHTEKSPTACRILLTSVNRDGDKHLVPYDPTGKDGPWWWDQDNDKHFRNPRFTLEFMFESELNVSACREVDFVKHHEFQCCIDPTNCPDRSYGPERGGALFVAGVVGENLDASILKFAKGKKNQASGRLDFACGHIQHILSKVKCTGTVRSSSTEANALARAAMAALYRRDKDEFIALSGLFKNTSSLTTTVESLIKGAFDLSSCFESD